MNMCKVNKIWEQGRDHQLGGEGGHHPHVEHICPKEQRNITNCDEDEGRSIDVEYGVSVSSGERDPDSGVAVVPTQSPLLS